MARHHDPSPSHRFAVGPSLSRKGRGEAAHAARRHGDNPPLPWRERVGVRGTQVKFFMVRLSKYEGQLGAPDAAA